jgi:hypothetical protein
VEEEVMTTQMHRLQISLPKAQAHFLRERARREGISAAEFIRRLLEREEQSAPTVTQADIDEALSFAGIGIDNLPLIDGKAVSEYPDLYLAQIYADLHESAAPSARVVHDKPTPDKPTHAKKTRRTTTRYPAKRRRKG